MRMMVMGGVSTVKKRRGRHGNALRSPRACLRHRDPSTAHHLRIREADASLRMTKSRKSFHDGRFVVGGVFFVGADLAVVLGIEGPVRSVELFGHHGENKAVFLALKADGVVAAVGIDHSLGK